MYVVYSKYVLYIDIIQTHNNASDANCRYLSATVKKKSKMDKQKKRKKKEKVFIHIKHILYYINCVYT